MKKIYSFVFCLCLFAYTATKSQIPQSFKYQTVARYTDGSLIQNQAVAFRISILQGGASGTLVYQERQLTTTNDFGLTSLDIGRGTVLFGYFNALDWAVGLMYLKVELDPAGGTAYTDMGTTEILSVPYALYSGKTGDTTTWRKNISHLYYKNGSVGIGTEEVVSSALFQMSSSNTGFLPPRLTYEQRKGIADPVDGLMVYCTDCNTDGSGALSVFQSGNWKIIALDCAVPTMPAEGINIPSTDHITWNWIPVPIADGYKWNTTNDYMTALDLGNSTTYIESGLNCGESYTRFLWAYNSCGKSDSVILTHETELCYTQGNGVTDINGFTYPTIIVGTQEWTQLNLLVNKYSNGDTIENITDAGIWHDCTSGAYHDYGGIRYYNWYAVNDNRGLCPAGWHVPTDADWTNLINYLGGLSVAGSKMLSWEVMGCGATNTSGFSSYITGYFGDYLEYITFPQNANWFSSSEFDNLLVYKTQIICDFFTYVIINTAPKNYGMTIRCIKDQ